MDATDIKVQAMVKEDVENQSSMEVPLEVDQEDEGSEARLSRREKFHLAALVLAWAFVISSMTLVVGTGAVVVKSTGGSVSIAPFALGMFFLGSAVVSLTVTPWLFERLGRRKGFLVGSLGFGMLGSVLGMLAIYLQSPLLAIFANGPIGCASGIGLYLRFAAVELVPSRHRAIAVTLVISGGCIAAFVGPESAQATKGIFGDDLTYFGVFMMTAIFYTLESFFVCLVDFGSPLSSGHSPPPASTIKVRENVTLSSVLQSRQFLVPAICATLSWAIMAMPMGIFRVTMGELGFTSRESLVVIEVHFLSMYFQYLSGKVIGKFGPRFSNGLAVFFFAIGTAINSAAPQDGTNIASWFLGLMFLGFGWNFGFSGATVWTTQAYKEAPYLKTKVQAANDFFMFAISGGFIFSSGYIVDGGGGGLGGWKTLNYTVLGLVCLFAAVLALESLIPVGGPAHPSKPDA